MPKEEALWPCFDGWTLSEHKPLGDKGEDAWACDFRRGDVHGQAVFDGCGGAGSWCYEELKDATGAFAASHDMALLFRRWFERLDARDLLQPETAARSLANAAEAELYKLKSLCRPMGIMGTIYKAFPCTASIALIQPEEDGALALTALQAGDSRVYFLTPESGLVQVTRDDAQGDPDPLDSMRASPPMSNMVNADVPFHITATRLALRPPCVVLCATDGVFGFFGSPMEFEYVLLSALMQSDTHLAFRETFTGLVRKVTGDDSTCVLSFYGFGPMKNVKEALAARYAVVSDLVKRIVAEKDPAARERVTREVWAGYKAKAVWREGGGSHA